MEEDLVHTHSDEYAICMITAQNSARKQDTVIHGICFPSRSILCSPLYPFTYLLTYLITAECYIS